MGDRLHQPYRGRAMFPWLDGVLAAARGAGALGAALSGAGPSVLGLAPAGGGATVAGAMAAALARAGHAGRGHVLPPTSGERRSSGSPETHPDAPSREPGEWPDGRQEPRFFELTPEGPLAIVPATQQPVSKRVISASILGLHTPLSEPLGSASACLPVSRTPGIPILPGR